MAAIHPQRPASGGTQNFFEEHPEMNQYRSMAPEVMTDEDLIELFERCNGDSTTMTSAIAAKWNDIPERKAVEGLASWVVVEKTSKKKEETKPQDHRAGNANSRGAGRGRGRSAPPGKARGGGRGSGRPSSVEPGRGRGRRHMNVQPAATTTGENTPAVANTPQNDNGPVSPAPVVEESHEREDVHPQLAEQAPPQIIVSDVPPGPSTITTSAWNKQSVSWGQTSFADIVKKKPIPAPTPPTVADVPQTAEPLPVDLLEPSPSTSEQDQLQITLEALALQNGHDELSLQKDSGVVSTNVRASKVRSTRYTGKGSRMTQGVYRPKESVLPRDAVEEALNSAGVVGMEQLRPLSPARTGLVAPPPGMELEMDVGMHAREPLDLTSVVVTEEHLETQTSPKGVLDMGKWDNPGSQDASSFQFGSFGDLAVSNWGQSESAADPWANPPADNSHENSANIEQEVAPEDSGSNGTSLFETDQQPQPHRQEQTSPQAVRGPVSHPHSQSMRRETHTPVQRAQQPPGFESETMAPPPGLDTLSAQQDPPGHARKQYSRHGNPSPNPNPNHTPIHSRPSPQQTPAQITPQPQIPSQSLGPPHMSQAMQNQYGHPAYGVMSMGMGEVSHSPNPYIPYMGAHTGFTGSGIPVPMSNSSPQSAAATASSGQTQQSAGPVTMQQTQQQGQQQPQVPAYPPGPGMNPYYYSPYYPNPQQFYYPQQYAGRGGYQGMYQQPPRGPYMYQDPSSPYPQYDGMYGVNAGMGMHGMAQGPSTTPKGSGTTNSKSGGTGNSTHGHGGAGGEMLSSNTGHASYAPYYGSRDTQPWSYPGTWAHQGMPHNPGVYPQSSPTGAGNANSGAGFSNMRKG